MSTNQTEHYGLHLWEPEDAFVRTEFNENTETLDTALYTAADQARLAAKSLPILSYNIYALALESYYARKMYGYRKGMMFDGFAEKNMVVSTTGGVFVRDNALRLSGVGSVGTMTGPQFWQDAETALIWIRYLGGNVTCTLNGEECTFVDYAPSINYAGEQSLEKHLRHALAGEGNLRFSLKMTSDSAEMQVFDYGIIFL